MSATLANVVHCGHHSELVLLEQDGAPLVATRDRLVQPLVDKVHDDLRWDDVLEELLAMLVALAVFLLRARFLYGILWICMIFVILENNSRMFMIFMIL